jgi:ParB/RepB/Spo0J family partition protein
MAREDKVLQQIIGSDENVKVEDMPVEKIRQNPYQPRRTFDAGSEKELAASIQEHGLLQPIVVRRLTDSGQHLYELVSGERRLRAFKALGKNTIPAIVRAIKDTEMRTIALIENLQRENLNIYESIKSIYLLREELGNNELVAKALSKSVRTIERHIKIGKELVNFPEVDRVFADNAAALDFASAQAFADIAANIHRLRKADKREYERIIRKFEKHGIKHTVQILTKRFSTSTIPPVKREASFVFSETPEQVILNCR